MVQAAKIIGTGLATTGLTGPGVGTGVVFGAGTGAAAEAGGGSGIGVAFDPRIIAHICHVKSLGKATRECDYSKILAMALPQFFPFSAGWFIAPEFVLPGNYSPDYLIGKICITPGANYGKSSHHLVVETKNHAAVSWWVLIKGQLWNQCDATTNSEGKIFCIGLIGFQICFFLFDLSKYRSPSDAYRNFLPLNLNNFTEEDLDYLEIEYLSESAGDRDIIRVVKWRLNNELHHKYILEMFEYVSVNTL